jgi:hypothetical protein
VADDKTKIPKEPAYLARNIWPDLDEQSSADKRSDRVTIKIFNADFFVPSALPELHHG